MFSLLIDKLPFFAAIVNHSYFYFLYFYHISDKRYCFFLSADTFLLHFFI